MRGFPSVLALLLAVVVLSGCAASLRPPSGGAGAPAPTAAVEQFLRAAQARDYQGMGWVFGTEKGSVIRRDPVPSVEKRMYAIASVLQHERHEIRDEAPVAGRGLAALRLDVRLHNGSNSVAVPFLVVRGPQNRWFVEEVDLQAVTNPRRS